MFCPINVLLNWGHQITMKTQLLNFELSKARQFCVQHAKQQSNKQQLH
jgi:hypothetical protein